jgi:hypothetical protein
VDNNEFGVGRGFRMRDDRNEEHLAFLSVSADE